MMKKKYLKYINNNFSSLEGKTVVITGGTGGIGFHISKYLVYLGAKVILAARNKVKTEKVISDINSIFPNAKIEYKHLDLTDTLSVNEFINYLETIKIDYLFLNSGIYNQECKLINGIDIHYMVNFYVPYKIVDKLKYKFIENKTKVVVTSSISYMFSKIELTDILATKCKNKTKLYGKTKRLLTQMLYLLKEENEELDIVFTHPGVTASTLFEGLHTNLFWKIAIPIMRHIFMSNDKASLPILSGINLSHDNRHWIGPKGLFQVWGYPGVKRVKKDLFNINEIKLIKEKIDEIEVK
jgi:NAD(P)-dependent dehydrogenase (short-subunit alcohol dehydrogenase family)